MKPSTPARRLARPGRPRSRRPARLGAVVSRSSLTRSSAGVARGQRAAYGAGAVRAVRLRAPWSARGPKLLTSAAWCQSSRAVRPPFSRAPSGTCSIRSSSASPSPPTATGRCSTTWSPSGGCSSGDRASCRRQDRPRTSPPCSRQPRADGDRLRRLRPLPRLRPTFHTIVIGASGNEVGLTIVRTIHAHGGITPLLSSGSSRAALKRTTADHRAIYDALLARDGDLAGELISAHIASAWAERKRRRHIRA